MRFDSSKKRNLPYNGGVVGGCSSRGGRGATWTFAGRVGSPGIFNAWLPSLTPTGVGAGSSSETMTYNAGSRLVTSVEGAVVSTYTFDANGNQTAVNAGGSRTTYAYDYENRMRTAIDPGGARSTMAYWADGMRRFLEVGGTRTTFVWDGSDYLQSRTPSEVTTISTVDAQILDSETGGSESLLVPDPLGSVVKVLDASGNQVYDAAYWPYGEIRSSVGVNDTSWGYVGTWGYHFDTSRRLYVRARVLDPVAGRWYTMDPRWPDERPFGYASQSPCVWIDPSGLSPGSNLVTCINAWVRLGYSAREACARCKAAQGYRGGFLCENLPDSGGKVPPWTGPPEWTGAVICAITSDFPFGNLLDPGEAACELVCSDSKPDGVWAGPQVKWCKDMCLKIRSGGCKRLGEYCGRLCGSGQEFACKSCMAFYNYAGCPTASVGG